ncbi:unnamed protein product [Ectocarpus sp. 12 AP-2014]
MSHSAPSLPKASVWNLTASAISGNVKLDTVILVPRESFMRASLNSLQTRSWMTCWRGLAGRWTPWSSA